jgi:hypothetical protein
VLSHFFFFHNTFVQVLEQLQEIFEQRIPWQLSNAMLHVFCIFRSWKHSCFCHRNTPIDSIDLGWYTIVPSIVMSERFPFFCHSEWPFQKKRSSDSVSFGDPGGKSGDLFVQSWYASMWITDTAMRQHQLLKLRHCQNMRWKSSVTTPERC